MAWYWWLLICAAVAVIAFAIGSLVQYRRSQSDRSGTTSYHLALHFHPNPPDTLIVATREFPNRVRADLQKALDEFLARVTITRFNGVQKSGEIFGIPFSALVADEENVAAWVVAAQYDDVDIGDEQPVRCVKDALWQLESDGRKFAIFCSQLRGGYCEQPRVQVCVAYAHDEDKFLADRLFQVLEETIRRSPCYRGKILSLEERPAFSGAAANIAVQRLRKVERDEIILPPQTLDLLDRNILNFVKHRAEMKRRGQSARKGLLFYGPPGNGKTHTLHYLFGALPDHTTLIITAEQIKHLKEYIALARLLQPSLVVLEDVDLISQPREEQGVCENAYLNCLLNEMDGLREEAEILFILTTNRPQSLETALAGRPGRIDQAIEFPRPDPWCRERLLRLYAAAQTMTPEFLRAAVDRTESTSAVFLKELIRRGIQMHLDRQGAGPLELCDLDAALNDLLIVGGRLNQALLGVEFAPSGKAAIL